MKLCEKFEDSRAKKKNEEIEIAPCKEMRGIKRWPLFLDVFGSIKVPELYKKENFELKGTEQNFTTWDFIITILLLQLLLLLQEEKPFSIWEFNLGKDLHKL